MQKKILFVPAPAAAPSPAQQPAPGAALGRRWAAGVRRGPCVGIPPRPHGDSGQSAPLGPPGELCPLAEEVFKGGSEGRCESCSPACRGRDRTLPPGDIPGHTHPARSHQGETRPGLAQLSCVLGALQVQQRWVASQLATQGHSERGDSAGRVGSRGVSQRQRSSDASSLSNGHSETKCGCATEPSLLLSSTGCSGGFGQEASVQSTGNRCPPEA